MGSSSPPRLEIIGRAASPGLVMGPLVFGEEQQVALRPTGSPTEEKTRLQSALDVAREEISDLVERQDDAEAAEILEFQLALLSDDALVEDTFAAIASGTGAMEAWSRTLDAMIEEYRTAADDYFQARAADLEDMAIRITAHLGGAAPQPIILPPRAIFHARELTPSAFLSTDWSRGNAIALGAGSPTAHVAILARARGIPMVVGLGMLPREGQADAILDGDSGRVLLSPTSADALDFETAHATATRLADIERTVSCKPARTADGHPVKVMINAGDPDELAAIDVETTDGIGLVRSEFLFHGRHRLPGEDEQYAAYCRILDWAKGKPVVLRTLDAGGDKPIAGLTKSEENPFLGLRGIRLSLARPDVFRVQIRAILRAAVNGDLKVMVPMVALPAEMDAVRDLFLQEADELAASGISFRIPDLGMMVEVPAAALTLDLFKVDFFSIGSNDLTQYVMAASRDATDLVGLDNAGTEAVQRLIRQIVEESRRLGVPVSICGDAGSDPGVLPRLLQLGLRSFSVSPAAVGRVKRIIAEVDTTGKTS